MDDIRRPCQRHHDLWRHDRAHARQHFGHQCEVLQNNKKNDTSSVYKISQLLSFFSKEFGTLWWKFFQSRKN